MADTLNRMRLAQVGTQILARPQDDLNRLRVNEMMKQPNQFSAQLVNNPFLNKLHDQRLSNHVDVAQRPSNHFNEHESSNLRPALDLPSTPLSRSSRVAIAKRKRRQNSDYPQDSDAESSSDLDYNQQDDERRSSLPEPEAAEDESSGAENGESDNQPEGDTNHEAQPSEESESSDQQENANNQEDPTSDDAANQSSDSEQSGDGEEQTQPDEEALRETGNAIDEEVDRMTQPSSGMITQQEQPFDYKNTVQFDDSLGTLSTVPKSQSGNQVARFVAPTSQDLRKRLLNYNKDGSSRDTDLQVDHNSLNVQNKAKPSRPKSTLNIRHKRSQKVSAIKNHNEIDDFLNKLNFDNLSQNLNHSNSQTTEKDLNDLDVGEDSSSYVKSPDKLNRKVLDTSLTRSRSNPKIDKRSDDEYDQDSYDDDRRKLRRQDGGDQQNYHYLTSNDTGLQQLLGERQLLEALAKSQLPAPVASEDKDKDDDRNSPSTDHQTAGSLYTIDNGLLLYPSADEEHHEKTKSMSKKKKKHEKKKAKKKMAIAFKKGGHKKKKHKKEEKKYIKEKKFKGVKKGKKVSKGKGGQGGKKGKKLYKDKGFKKKGFKNVYHKEEFGQKKSYFDEFRDKDFKKKWKKFDDKYNYAQMKKWQGKDLKGAKKMKDHGANHKKYEKGIWKKKYQRQSKEHSASSKKKSKKSHGF